MNKPAPYQSLLKRLEQVAQREGRGGQELNDIAKYLTMAFETDPSNTCAKTGIILETVLSRLAKAAGSHSRDNLQALFAKVDQALKIRQRPPRPRLIRIYMENIQRLRHAAVHFRKETITPEEADFSLQCTYPILEWFLNEEKAFHGISPENNKADTFDLLMVKEQNKAGKKLRGVNLGGWLVLEKWMTPSLFEGMKATDETTWSVELGGHAQERLKKHWDSFIVEEDFQWLTERGINAVRIPVGFWLFGPPYPHHPAYGENPTPFARGGDLVLDRAFEWAEKHRIHIVLDLHAAPGCQNGFDNGGLLQICDWATKQEYIDFSLDFLERLARRYGQKSALIGIELLNEPRWDIPTDTLKDFYLNAYHLIRQHAPSSQVAIVFNDGFRSHNEFNGFMREPDFSNVVFDIHRYQCFDHSDIDTDIYGHIQKAAIDWKNEADEIITELNLWTYVGEWSLGLDLKVVSLWAEGPFNHALEQMDEFQINVARRAYAAAQLATFEKYLGWFFWSYKTETTPEWCFRECVERGWLPRHFA